MNSVLSSHDSWPTVSVVIINYNGKEYLDRCLGSVLSSNYPNFEVIFVDNASSDGSLEYVKKKLGRSPRLRIIRNERNVGFGEGNNIGLRASMGEYVALLNSDTEVDSNWLKELVSIMNSNSSIGIVQSKLLRMDRPDRLSSAGLLLLPFCGWTIRRGGDAVDDGSFDYCDYICCCGNGILIRRKIINEIGGLFDSTYFVFFDDVDLALRVWLRGYKIVLAPKSIVYHAHGRLVKGGRYGKTEYLHYRNCIRMLIKNYSRRSVIKYLPLAMAAMLCQALIIWKESYLIHAFFRGILSNLKFLPDTMRERYKVQRLVRRVSDKSIFERIGARLTLVQIYRRHLTHL